LVRGAYIEGERKLAMQNGVSSPVCQTKDETDQNYDRIVSMLIKEASKSKLECVLAGHNENSIIAAVDQLSSQTELFEQVRFAQLYGMGDHISMALGEYPELHVYKSMPYGTIEETLPYIARRAVENRSILDAAVRERMILRNELISRCKRI